MFCIAKLYKILALRPNLRYFRSHKSTNGTMALILAFAGSNSKTSVNFKLVEYTTSMVSGHEVELLNMANQFFPMYSEDHEKEKGFPENVIQLKEKITKTDALIISVNEHNSGPSAYFKNLLDWLSRLDRAYMTKTKVLLMSTSPGKRGGTSAHEFIKNSLPRVGAEIVSTFSLPSFYTNFEVDKGIIDARLSQSHKEAVDEFLAEI